MSHYEIDDETLWDMCKDKSFRHQFAFLVLGRGLARQLRAMRKARGWTLKQTARRAGISWPHLWRLEKWCGNASIHTLTRLAEAFDVALIVRFVGWGEFFLSLNAYGQVPPSFNDEMKAQK